MAKEKLKINIEKIYLSEERVLRLYGFMVIV